MNKTIEEKIVKGLIVYTLLVVTIFTLSSCSSTYNCPAYGSVNNVNTNANG